MSEEIVRMDQDLLNRAILAEAIGVNRVHAHAEIEEAHGPLYGIVLCGRFAKAVFAGHPSSEVEMVWICRIEDLGHIIGRIRAACEMHGAWKEVSAESDKVAAAQRATWDTSKLGGSLPAEYVNPPELGDLGSGKP